MSISDDQIAAIGTKDYRNLSQSDCMDLFQAIRDRDATIAELRAKLKSIDDDALDMITARSFMAERDLDKAQAELAELRQKWQARRPTYDPTVVEDADRIETELSQRGLHGAAQLIPRLLRALRDSQAEVEELRKPVAVAIDPKGVQEARDLDKIYRSIASDAASDELSVEAKYFLGILIDTVSAYDALAQQVAGYSNAHAVLMAERDSAKSRVRFLEELTDSIEKQLGIETDEQSHTIGSRIEELRAHHELCGCSACLHVMAARGDLAASQERERQLREVLAHVRASAQTGTSDAGVVISFAALESVRAALSASPAPAVVAGTASAMREIRAERLRQVAVEGWSIEHDDSHRDFELSKAAAMYCAHAAWHGWDAEIHDRYTDVTAILGSESMPGWPKQWILEWFKPKTPRHDLVRAAALIVAEIERMDRDGALPAVDHEGKRGPCQKENAEHLYCGLPRGHAQQCEFTLRGGGRYS